MNYPYELFKDIKEGDKLTFRPLDEMTILIDNIDSNKDQVLGGYNEHMGVFAKKGGTVTINKINKEVYDTKGLRIGVNVKEFEWYWDMKFFLPPKNLLDDILNDD